MTSYVLIFLCFLSYAVLYSPGAVVPIVGFFVLICPAFLMCCALLLLFVRSLAIPSFLFSSTPKSSIFFRSERSKD